MRWPLRRRRWAAARLTVAGTSLAAGCLGSGYQARPAVSALVAYLRQRQPGSRYLLATQGSVAAGPYLLAGARFGRLDGTPGSPVRAWVRTHCVPVPASSYPSAGDGTDGFGTWQVLYDCRPAWCAAPGTRSGPVAGCLDCRDGRDR